jgi:hypothetical protein
MSEIADVSKIATELITRYSDSFFNKFSEFSRAQLNSLSAFIGLGLTNLIAKQLKQIEHVKTFLSFDTTLFIDTYVNLTLKQGKFEVRDDDIGMGADRFTRLLVLGTAGSGKSMFMKYMVYFLTNNSNRIPILIELRNYNSFSGSDFVDFIYDLTRAEQAISRDLLISLLKKGGFVFLLDGLDEVDFDRRPQIEREIDSLVRRFEANSFVATSRPTDNTPNWPGFQTISIQPLSLDAAKLLVKKSSFEDKVKEEFIEQMDSLIHTHRSFLSNPLLTTIMLLLFKDVIKIPSKRNVFYSVAFDVLFYRHDAYKPGRLHRKKYTNLALTEFRDAFSVFCAVTYSNNEYAFFVSHLVEHLQTALKYCNSDANAEDFRKDLHESVAMLQADGIRYTFSHRSFQEYFTALFLSNDAYINFYHFLDGIVARQETDTVVDRLREINKGKFEKGWVIPYLHKVISELDDDIEKGRLSQAISRLFGNVRFFAKQDRIGLCIDEKSNFSPEPGLALIERLYISKSEIANFFEAPWIDPLVSDVASSKIAVSSDFIVDAAQSTVKRIGGKRRFVSESFKCSPVDDKWLSATNLVELSCEKVNLYRSTLRLLETQSHEKGDLIGHFFRRSSRTTENAAEKDPADGGVK